MIHVIKIWHTVPTNCCSVKPFYIWQYQIQKFVKQQISLHYVGCFFPLLFLLIKCTQLWPAFSLVVSGVSFHFLVIPKFPCLSQVKGTRKPFFGWLIAYGSHLHCGTLWHNILWFSDLSLAPSCFANVQNHYCYTVLGLMMKIHYKFKEWLLMAKLQQLFYCYPLEYSP